MITLALQIFLLLLSAYLAGCMVGCILRRALHEPKPVAAAVTAPLDVPTQPRPAAPPADQARFETALTGKTLMPVPVAPPGEPVVEVRPRPAPAAFDSRTAEIEIIKAPVASPETTTVRDIPAAPATPAEPPAPIAADSEPLPLPPPPPPPPMGAAQMASYAAVAAAAAAARAAVAAETANRPERPSSIEPELEPEPIPEPEIMAAIDTITFVDVEPAPEPDTALQSEPDPEPDPEPDAEPAHAEPVAIAMLAEPQQVAPTPAPMPAPTEPEAPAPLPSDDLKRIRGIDAGLQSRLNAQNILHFADIASWTAADVTRMSQSLGVMGRIEQENWIEQAQILARGSETEYSRRQRVTATTAAVGMAAATAAAAANALVHWNDRLTRIIGIDTDTEKILNDLGVTRYAEIARWTSSDIERVEAVLDRPGRVGLDNWVEQARVLARYASEGEVRPAAAAESEPRPVRLADAIRENRAAKTVEPAAPRTDIAGLRSVRSQALRGETPSLGDRVDDLKRIRGIGVLIEKRLNALGITSYEQVANWTKADIDSVSTQLDFKGRVERENWIEQARILASGGQTEFSRRVDRGEVETSKNN